MGQGAGPLGTVSMNLRRAVSKVLKARGFRQFERMHLLPVDSDFSVWVDTGPIGKQEDIAPFAGLRHEGVENLVADLLGEPRFEWTATVGANVGYILETGYRYWMPPAEAEEVLAAVEGALVRLRGFMPLSCLVGAWTIEGAERPGWRFKEIAARFLAGDRDGMAERLDAARIALCKHEDEICEQYRLFAANLSKRMG